MRLGPNPMPIDPRERGTTGVPKGAASGARREEETAMTTSRSLLRALGLGVAGVVFGSVLTGLAAQAARAESALTVYTTSASEDLKLYRDRFNKVHPDIKIRWVRDSTGIITSKLLSEKDNPQADVVYILAGTSMMILAKEGMFQPYTPKGYDAIDAKFKDRAEPPNWVGNCAFIATVCFNEVEAEKKNLPKPVAWKDLLNPAYKGQIVMSNPNSSGTGYLNISAWIQTMGEKTAWNFFDGLHENIAVYLHSGSKPCVMAATGEFPIGISFAFRGVKEKKKGAPIDIISPSEGLGWEILATGIVKGTKNLDAAKKFVDWANSTDANELYNRDYAVISIPSLAKPVQYYPDKPLSKMIDNDFYWAAEHRKRILAEWSKRYDAKSAPKK
jgi:iron(III) transport system substrate-binding protein